MIEKNWIVYLLRCSDNSLYCGISNNLEKRLIEHNSGKGAKYTRSRRPVELVGVSPEMTKGEALKLEYKIKKLPAEEKVPQLTKNKKNEKGNGNIEKKLQSLQKEFKALGKKVEKLTKAVEKAEKAQAKAAKAKTVKKAPAKKKTPAKKKAPVKKKTTVTKKAAATKTKTTKAKKKTAKN